jgi:hypothetical protein
MYTVRLGLAGDYASALARLALWCADNDLQVEAAEAEAAALRGKPDDPDIRELLGYIREKPGGPWVKMDWWRAKVIKATLTVGYSDNTFSYSPEDNSLAVGQVEVEFEALSAAPGNLQERLGPAKDILTKEALAYLMGGEAPGERGNEGAELVRRPSRLFMSPNVLLVLADGTKIPPAFTSRLPGYGCTIGGNTIELSSTWSVTTESAPVGVIRYIRGDRLTAALVEPRKKVTVTFVYPVPVGTRQATLRFYNCPPTSLTFIKG